MKGIRITEVKQKIQAAAADIKNLRKDKLLENFTNDVKKRQIAWTIKGQPITEAELEFGLKEEWGKIGFVYRAAGITWDELLAAGKAAIVDTNGTYEVSIPKPIQRLINHIGRNQSCPCGSRLKYKKCCGKGI